MALGEDTGISSSSLDASYLPVLLGALDTLLLIIDTLPPTLDTL